ncbi:MAG: zf-TFIIB domain-containing protein [Candidatus Wildermuthbacteria bacterium]|nr:zf-TFIIB domain-containing protein [Candidatus Wildermuthbacteria bacterium]
MKCPQCKTKLDQALMANVEVDYCPRCYGIWFDQDELRWAKDEKDRDFRWVDIDLWKDEGKFKISPGLKLCPKDRMPLYETEYGDSGTRVDVCNLCYGVWLDRGEFKAIVSYIQEKGNQKVLYAYLKNFVEETWEVFSGPELLKEELLDVLAVIKMLRYKFAVQHPTLSRIIGSLPT